MFAKKPRIITSDSIQEMARKQAEAQAKRVLVPRVVPKADDPLSLMLSGKGEEPGQRDPGSAVPRSSAETSSMAPLPPIRPASPPPLVSGKRKTLPPSRTIVPPAAECKLSGEHILWL